MSAKKETWTPSRIEELRSRYTQDGPSTLAKEWGMTAHSVIAKARRMGVLATRKRPPRRFEWSEEMLAEIRARYVAEGGDALASEFGVALSTLRKKASSLGLHTNAGHVRAGNLKAYRSDSCNIHYFDQWSPPMAYILGFLFADGSITKDRKAVRVCLCHVDESVLWHIKRELQSRHPIKHRPADESRQGRKSRPQSVLTVSSTVIVNSLMAKGMMPRKTYNDDPFPDVPDAFLGDFARGYLDGDGCVHIREDCCSVSLVGAVRFVTGLQQRLNERLGLFERKAECRQGKTATYCVVTWNRNEDLRRIYDCLYPEGHGFCLDRKKAKLAEWLGANHQPRKTWDEFEDEVVRRYYPSTTPRQLAAVMGKTTDALKIRARHLGVSAKRKKRETHQ